MLHILLNGNHSSSHKHEDEWCNGSILGEITSSVEEE